MKDKKVKRFRYRALGGGTTLINERGVPVPWELLESGSLSGGYEYQITFPRGDRMVLGIDDFMEIEDISGPCRLEALRLLTTLLGTGDRILEIGSSGGYSCHVLSRLVAEIHGLDWREDWVFYATHRYGGPKLSFHHLPAAKAMSWPPTLMPRGLTGILMFNPIGRGLAESDFLAILERLRPDGGELPLFWAERVLSGETTNETELLTRMKKVLDQLAPGSWRNARVGGYLCVWSAHWPGRGDCPPIGDDPGEGIDWLLRRSRSTLVFGPGIPGFWPCEGVLRDQDKTYGIWESGTSGKGRVRPLFGSTLPTPGSGRDLVWGVGVDPPVWESLVSQTGPGALWRYARGEADLVRLRTCLAGDLKAGRSVEGYFDSSCREMLVRLDLSERLPLYPLLDASTRMPAWGEVAAYLDWTRKKAMVTLNPEQWETWRKPLSDQTHRGLLILVGFNRVHLDRIADMARDGWRIALGANRPMDQVPLQSFEEFRLLLEGSGVQIEALWMGSLPPDPAYIKNIYSRFGRLLISTRSVFPSWDVKRVRFCVSLGAGDVVQQRLLSAYFQMAGLDVLEDFIMLYRWASALEKAGHRQAAKLIFSRLLRARVAAELGPTRRLAGVHFHLGRIAEAESDFYSACRHYLRCRTLQPDFTQAAERLYHLNHAETPKGPD